MQKQHLQYLRSVASQLSRHTSSPKVWGNDEWEVAIQQIAELRQVDQEKFGFTLFPCNGSSSPKHDDANGASTSPLQALQELLDPDKDGIYGFDTISPEKGNGLRATGTIEKGDIVISIPRQHIIQADIHSTSSRWHPYKNDILLKTFPSALLALELLAQATAVCGEGTINHDNHGTTSPLTRAYIHSLPHNVPLPLYYNTQEFKALQGTSAFHAALQLLYHTIKQYCYLYQLIFDSSGESRNEPPIPEAVFTFSNFLWATSIVSSRQNSGPNNSKSQNGNSSPQSYVLIPGWDMINHEAGGLTSEWSSTASNNGEDYELVFRAMRNYQHGEEITMCYGERSNRDFLVYAGFIPSDNNPYDKTTVRAELAVGNNADPDKARLLVKHMLGIQVQTITADNNEGTMSLELDVLPEGVLDGFGWQALLILVMSSDELNQLLEFLNRQETQEALESFVMNDMLDPEKKLISTATVRQAQKYIRLACQLALLDLPKSVTNDCVSCNPSFHAAIQRFVASEQANLEACIAEYITVTDS
jgi:SET domain